MTAWLWASLTILLLIVIGVWLWRLAVRIDRLHRRVISSRNNFGKALVKRGADSLKLADSGLLDAESSAELAYAARKALALVEFPVIADGIEDDTTATDIYDDRRYVVESALSQELRQLLDEETRTQIRRDPLGEAILGDLETTWYRVRMTRALHNQNVSLVRNLRQRWVVRIFHLAGWAALPQYVDLDDAI